MADTGQFNSMPLSQLAMDDSSPPVMHYGMHVPAKTSTPTYMEGNTHSSQQEDSYQQIIPGIPQGSLYPTLASLSSEAITSQDEAQSLHNKVSKGLEKYLQDAKQCRALEVNYFDDNTTGQNKNRIQKTQNRQFNFPKIMKCHSHRSLLQTLM